MRTILFVLALLGAVVGRGQIVLDWYGVAAAPANPLLDDYPGAARAYSLRLLRSAYTGNCVIVRRASDNALDTIGFVGGVVDTATLKTFCASTDCFVRTWFDQSTNASNANSVTNANQPAIVTNGDIIRHDGEPTIQSQTNTHRLVISSVTVASVYVVAKVDTSVGRDLILGSSSFTAALVYGGTSGGVNGIAVISNAIMSTTIENTNENLVAAYTDASTDAIYVNGSQEATGSVNTFTANSLFFLSSTSYFLGKAKEIIIYSTDQFSNHSGIQSNINNFYNTY